MTSEAAMQSEDYQSRMHEGLKARNMRQSTVVQREIIRGLCMLMHKQVQYCCEPDGVCRSESPWS